jgi:hypothetical protein
MYRQTEAHLNKSIVMTPAFAFYVTNNVDLKAFSMGQCMRSKSVKLFRSKA